MQFLPLSAWEIPKSNPSPLLIAGPCSAESPQQVMQAALIAQECGAHLLRAGIWKPRTRPHSFQGMGAQALPWLQAAKAATGLPICIEVANASHVELALEHEVDAVWIGARTTVSPFTVQELAEALRGTDLPVMVKNPINPDLELWIGAIERMYAVGLRKLAAIHRGFSVYKSAPYRNAPMWEIPIELERRHPDLPLLCDPSHISGHRQLVPSVAHIANQLGFDGLMIEVHPQPEDALSDAQQQLTAAELIQLMHQLTPLQESDSDPAFQGHMESYRRGIDLLDKEIITLLAARMRISQKIGALKRNHGVTVFQLDRWNQIFNSRIQATQDSGLSAEFAQAFMRSMHQESIRQQLEEE